MNYLGFSMLSLSPFLVFEVLEGQVYNLLDESIQKRMQWNLDHKKKTILN